MRTTTPHWVGFGATTHAALPNPQNRPVINVADDLLAWLDVNGCTQASIPAVSTFQAAYNGSGLPGQLTIDGQYGPNTQRALQNTMDQAQADAGAGPSQSAPQNCFTSGEATIPTLDTPLPSPTPAPTTVVVNPAPATPSAPPSTPTNYTPYVVGGAAAIAAVAGGVWLARRRKRHAH